MSFKLAVQRYAKWVAIIVTIWIVASIAAIWVLSQERLASPFAKKYEVQAQFDNLTGVAAGLGLPVNVAGVAVGQISKVRLQDGKAIATLRIDPGKLKHVYKDARAVLVPNTLLKDMRINLAPGTPKTGTLGDKQVIPSSHTTDPIDLDELLAGLDADTRSYFQSLLSGFDQGLHGRGKDLRAILRSLGPTSEQLKQIGDLIAARRHTLPKLVHDLHRVLGVAGSRDRQIAAIVTNGNRTLQSLASQDTALRTTLAKLPTTLDLTSKTLTHTKQLTDELTPTLKALLPTARNLPQTLRDTKLIFKGGALLPLKQLRQFVGAAQPLSSIVPPAIKDLSAQTPPLTDAFKVLEYTVNELAYNSGGPSKSFLYWTAWFAHNANSATSTADAYGGMVRGSVAIGCSSFAQSGAVGDLLKLIIGSSSGCPGAGG
jgi:phospholipid/cholesterol/gamma-HCH transport system substrate-binding protein